MFRKAMATVGAALVLASSFAATDASAAGRVTQGLRNPAVNAGGQKAFASRVPANRNTNFGFSGPYIGLKFIGK
jgi:hypothetical protein